MKKFLFVLLCLCSAFIGFSQHVSFDKAQAYNLVKSTAGMLHFSADDIADLAVSESYSDKSTGVIYIYLQQMFMSVPVLNRIIVLAYRDGKPVSKSGELFNNAREYSNGVTPEPATSGENAVATAAMNVKAKSPSLFTVPVTTDNKSHYGNLGIAYEDITTQLFWMEDDRPGVKKLLKLVWQVFLAPANSDDMWYVRVDAKNNSVVNKINLTVYENFTGSEAEHTVRNNKAETSAGFSPDIVNNANYLVVPYPVESPLYGPATLQSNPWTMTGAFNANAVTLKWHNDGTTDYSISRGNNVWATEDRANTNSGAIVTPTGLPATSSTSPDPLNFNFPPDYTVEPITPAFQQYAITNLFYWNNIMHDISYNYGFNEVSGNFQASNQGRGGAGSDYVIAIAQSASGTNNANFATPPDGSRPRMRMYLFTAPTPDRDGDLDNGIIAHEYTHGISNRLTGGIAGGGGCLSNAEEGGEGWSDYFGLMVTTNWATAQITDGFNLRRPIGNYALGQGTTGGGFRSKPYTTNFAINNLTYAYVNASGGEVHSIGEVWCATLWDMTWNMIQMDGIAPNLFNSTALAGNTAALKLVIEGMRLQPCSPGFIDARDAILQADQILYAGRYHCAILSAFARRGMGTDARQGSSGATNDQIVGFSTVETSLSLTQNVTQQQEGLNITYTNHVTAGACNPVVNFNLTDTLPLNVTYVSGGTYNATNRVVSFAVNLAAGASQDYAFTVQINTGAYFPTINVFEDNVTGTTVPSSVWTTSSTTSTNWVVSAARSHTPPSSYFSANNPVVSDQQLFSTNQIPLGSTPPNLSFWHWYNTESTYDGGVLEISTNNGATYSDIGAANFITGGYTGLMSTGTPLAGRNAWTGNSGGFVKTVVNLAAFANQSIKLKFRSTTDLGTSLEGWYVDDIAIKSVATVDIKSSLFNAGGVRVNVADTFTIILPTSVCSPVGISAHPANVTACTGNSATFSVTATGTTPIHQWQVSTNGGASYTNITGANAATYVISPVTAVMNGYKYRDSVSNTCPSFILSNAATLSVNPGASITTQPVSTTVCAGNNASFSVTAPAGFTYQWQVSTDAGATFTNISGATASTLTLTAVSASMNNYQYHVIVSNSCPSSVTSSNVTLTVQTAPAITTQPSSANTCTGNAATFSVAATGTNLTYQWQVSTTGCAGTFTNITGATAASYTTQATTTAMNGYGFQVIISGICTPSSVTSNCVTLNVNTGITITSQPVSQAVCSGTAVTFTTTATGSGINYQWQVSTDGGLTYTNIAGATSPSYTFTALASQNGNLYRTLITSTCIPGGVTGNVAILNVSAAPAITVQPADIGSCSTNVTFTVTATGTGLTYQWQVSTDGGVTYTNIPGANNAVLNLTNLSPSSSANKYRVIISSSGCGSVTSTAVSARVGVTPVVVLTAAPYTATNPSRPTSLFTTISPPGNYVFSWYRDNVLLPGYTSTSTFTDIWDDFGTYKVIITDVSSGCTATSNIVTINDIAGERNTLFIYPNPTQGAVQIRYYSNNISQQARTLNLYDSKGSRILTKLYSTTGRYGRMDLDLSGMQQGVYRIELLDVSGKKLAGESIIKY